MLVLLLLLGGDVVIVGVAAVVVGSLGIFWALKLLLLWFVVLTYLLKVMLLLSVPIEIVEFSLRSCESFGPSGSCYSMYGIFKYIYLLYIWLIVVVNVGTYTIHGASGYVCVCFCHLFESYLLTCSREIYCPELVQIGNPD